MPPDEAARQAILEHCTKGRPQKNLDFGWLAARGEGLSGADLTHLVDAATEFALEESITQNVVVPISMAHFKLALPTVKKSTLAWLEHAKNFVMFGNSNGEYNDLAAYLKSKRML